MKQTQAWSHCQVSPTPGSSVNFPWAGESSMSFDTLKHNTGMRKIKRNCWLASIILINFPIHIGQLCWNFLVSIFRRIDLTVGNAILGALCPWSWQERALWDSLEEIQQFVWEKGYSGSEEWIPFCFFKWINLFWGLITLQHCGGFCHTLTWFIHACICVPPSWTPLPPPSPGFPF